ncbi:hypothetical protein V5E97_08500 [Singulisphaera sp. Ch08]|uniref:Uncharacterized protein n=1 Tax=Singulisphaera sp. Ch08 TaxID=3120278 RepID=A0AAU7CN53_9BACT
MMRRLVLAVLLGLVAARSDAGELYYSTPGDPNSRNIYAVNENGGTPRVVLYGSEYPSGSIAGMTRFNHAGSNGQALVQAKPYSAPAADIQLVYRASNGQVITRPVTDLEGEGLNPYGDPELAQDDSFFSFRARDGAGRSTIWRLNVTVDQALAPDYVPPASFDDPRLHLVVDDPTNGAENHGHTWSPEGTRLAYLDTWMDAGGVGRISIRIKIMAAGSTDPLSHPRILDTLRETSIWAASLHWSPVSDQILNFSRDANGRNCGIWVCYADSPGVMTWVAKPITTKSKTQTVTEELRLPLWRPDGQRIACAYTKYTTNKLGTTTRSSSRR